MNPSYAPPPSLAPAAIAPAPARSQPKGWLATLVVLLVMVGIVGVGFYADALVANVPAQPVTVADGVVITPGNEWEFAGRSDDGMTVLLTQGVGSLAIGVTQGADARAALEVKRNEWLADEKVTAGSIETWSEAVAPYRTGLRFSYSGSFEGVAAPVEGEVTAIAGTGVTVLFDGWAGIGEYRSVQADVDSMIGATAIP